MGVLLGLTEGFEEMDLVNVGLVLTVGEADGIMLVNTSKVTICCPESQCKVHTKVT